MERFSRILLAVGLAAGMACPPAGAAELEVLDRLSVGGSTVSPYGGIGRYQNLLLQSENLATTWADATATAVTVSADLAAANPAPNGTTTADRLTQAASTAGAGRKQDVSVTTAAGGRTFTVSVWLKAATAHTARLQLKTATNTQAAQSVSVTTAWQRFSDAYTVPAGDTNTTLTAIIDLDDGATYNTLDVWGAQVEEAAGPGVYVRTTTAIVAASQGVVTDGIPTGTGGGSVTQISTGQGLTGGPITGSGTISVGNGGITDAMLAGSITNAKLAGPLVNAITAGAGIGAVTNPSGVGAATLAVDVGTTANKIVQLDAAAKLPAVDSSQLTALNASNLASGTVADARLSLNVPKLDAANVFNPGAVDLTPLTVRQTSAATPAAAVFNVTNNGGTSPYLTVNAAGNVGIGTTGPGSKLDVQGGNLNVSGTGAFGSYLQVNSNYLQIGLQASGAISTGSSGDISIGGNSGNVLLISGTATPVVNTMVLKQGNVGIGTTSPAQKLDVAGNIQTRDGDKLILDGIGDTYLQESAGLNIVAGSTRSINLAGGTGTDVTITSAGNVGIGTTGPANRLHVVVDDATTNAVTRVLRLDHSTTGTAANGIGAELAFIVEDAGGTLEGAGTIQGILTDATAANELGALAFATKSSGGSMTEKVRIDSAGNVGLGTTSPTALLHVKGTLTAALTGTVAVTNLATTVTGTGTAFTTELSVGDAIKLGTTTYTVAALGSATSLTLGAAYSGATASGLTAYKDPTLLAIDTGNAVNKLTLDKSGTLSVAGLIESTSGGVKFPDGTTQTTSAATPTFGTLAGGTNTSAALLVGSGASLAPTGTGTVNANRFNGNAAIAISDLAAGDYAAKITSGTYGISITGNAATATNGLISTGSYADPAWLTSVSGAKVSGNIPGNAANVTGTVAVANGGTGTATGSITGTGALTFAAGGANQNVTLTPSGTGYTLLNGNVGIGTTGPSSPLHIAHDGPNDNALRLDASSGASGSQFYIDFRKVRTGLANPTALSANDNIGGLNFKGYNDAFRDAAAIQANVDTGVGATGADMPGRLTFWTTPDGSATLAERMRIDNAGNVGIGTTSPIGFDVTNRETQTPLLDFGDVFSDYVVTGLLPATSLTLTSDLSAGTAYVVGRRIRKAAATPKTYTASKDTYVDLDQDGAFVYAEVLTGAAAPAVAANALRLAKVVTSATAITGVTDLRATSTNLTGVGAVNSSGNLTASGNLQVTGAGPHYIANGNVGIGTTAPNRQLELANIGGENRIRFKRTDNTLGSGMIEVVGSDNTIDWSFGVNRLIGDAFEVVEDDTNVRFAVLAGGNVGIGAATPNQKLTVTGGNVYVTDDNTGVIVDSNNLKRVGLMKFATLEGALVHTNTVPLRLGRANVSDLTSATQANFTPELVIDTSGNVGIGTTGPTAKLTVNGAASIGTGANPGSYQLYVNNGQMLFDGAKPIFFDPVNGQVGIGTTSPAANLHIFSGSNTQLTIDRTTTGSVTLLSFRTSNVADWSFQTETGASSNLSLLDSGNNRRVSFTQSGNVGIGTTAPGTKLEVKGGVLSVSDVTSTELRFIYGGANQWSIFNGLDGSGKFSLYDNVAAKTRMLLDASGNVGIGTISPSVKLDVQGGDAWLSGNLASPYGGLGRYANLLTSSDAFENAAWVKTNVAAVTADGILAPDGSTTAEALAPATAATTTLKQTSGTVAAASTAYTASVWLQVPAGTKTLVLTVGDGATNATASAALTTTWQRFSVTYTSAATPTGSVFAQLGDATWTSGTIHAWGAQLEQAATPGVYAKTTTAAIPAGRGIVSTGDFLMPSLKLTGGSITDTSGTVTVGSNLASTGNLQVTGAGPHYISQGNVGIGTTAPATLLHLAGASPVLEIQETSGTGAHGLLLRHGTFDTYFTQSGGADSSIVGSVDGDAIIRTSKNILFSTDSGSTANVYIKNGGQVGIGTTSPTSLLHVSGSNSQLRLTQTLAGGATFELGVGQVSTNNKFSIADVTGARADRLTIDSSGNVGIGTTGPGATLDVVGNGRFSTGLIAGDSKFYNSVQLTNSLGGTTQAWMWSDTTNQMKLGVGTVSDANTKVTINSAGNVGIGTTGPGAKLDVRGSTTLDLYNGGSGGRVLSFRSGIDDGTNMGLVPILGSSGSAYDGLNFNSYGGLSLRTGDGAGGLVDRLVVKYSSGNVGIGTTTPEQKLVVVGGAGISTQLNVGSTAATGFGRGLEVTSANGVETDFRLTQTGAISWDMIIPASTTRMSITNSASEKVTFLTNGNVGIGTTAPAAKLHVAGGAVAVDADQKISLKGAPAGSDTYQVYESASGKLWMYVNGQKVAWLKD